MSKRVYSLVEKSQAKAEYRNNGCFTCRQKKFGLLYAVRIGGIPRIMCADCFHAAGRKQFIAKTAVPRP